MRPGVRGGGVEDFRVHGDSEAEEEPAGIHGDEFHGVPCGGGGRAAVVVAAG